MGAALILAGLALTCLGIFGWLWLCGGVQNPGWRGLAGKLALQLSALCLIYGLIRGQPLNGVFLAMFPPLVLAEVAKARDFLPFLIQVAWRVAPYAAAALGVCLVVRPLRALAPGLTLCMALIVAVFVGDTVSQTTMCKAATKRGFTAFQRNAFDWSLANSPREWQWEIHARAVVDGQPLGWSYRELDWYAIPKGVSDGVSGPIFTCPSP